jgi:hypothetical protein
MLQYLVKGNLLTAVSIGMLKVDCSQLFSAHGMESMSATIAQDAIDLN